MATGRSSGPRGRPVGAASRNTAHRVQAVLRQTFGLERLRPGQREVIDRILAGENTLALMPTGAGKSLCYQLPAVLLPGRTLVVSPLIALMQDQCDHLRDLGIPAVQWHSAQDATANAAADAAWDAGQARIGFLTPERLIQPEFLAALRRTRIDLLVVDEAHCISQWGHDFRPAYQELDRALSALRGVRVLALTATASPQVQEDIRRQLRIPATGVVVGDSHRPNLHLAVDVIDAAAQKLARVLEHLGQAQGPSILYTATVKAAQELQAALLDKGVEAGLYHGQLSAAARRASQEAFMKGDRPVMVATNAFGLGIDKPDIRLVLHYQMPAALDVYYQEAGRAGRDGAPAVCVLLYLRSDRTVQQFFLNGRYPCEEDGSALMQTLALPPPGPTGWTLDALRQRLGRPMTKLRVLGNVLRREGWIEGEAQGPWRPGLHTGSKPIAALLQAYAERGERDRERLEAMVSYAQGGRCRWRMLLDFFEEQASFERCGECDNCRRMVTHETQAALDEEPARASQTAEPAETGDAQGLKPGVRVRVNHYGWGEVVRTGWDSVTVSFGGRERSFHPGFVQPERTPAARRTRQPA